MMETNSLLQRYRNDRRKLLEFLLSCGLIKEIRTPSGPTFSLSNVNLDVISADYVLECVQSGGVLDVSLAAKKYHDERRLPKIMQLHTGDTYFLVTDPESAGSHPQRVPPSIMKNHSNNNGSCHSDLTDSFLYCDDYGVNSKTAGTAGSFAINQADVPSIGIPALKTGLLDDDLRESAYEVFLTCVICSGLEVRLAEGKKKEKSPRFLSGLKRKEKRHSRSLSGSLSFNRNTELFEIFRTQMQISEAMDALTRRKLVRLASEKSFGQIDIPQITLGLLNGTTKSEFLNEKSYIQWKKRQ